MTARISKIRSLIVPNNVDAVLVKNEESLIWATTLRNTHGYLIVTKKKAYFFVNKLMFETCTKVIKWAKVICIEAIADVYPITVKTMKEDNIIKLGFENHGFTFEEFEDARRKLKALSLSPIDTKKMRMIKDEKEIADIQKACDIVDRTFKALRKYAKPGMTEEHIATWVDIQMLKEGAIKPSFSTIVASGPNGSIPHHIPGNRKVKAGELITLDFGAFYKNYCSDMTRTFSIGKIKNKKLVEIYNVVYEAQVAGCKAAKPGMTTKELDAVCRRYIESKGFGDYFCHGTGHGYGVEVHEWPRVSTYCDVPLEVGTTVTIEPGIYIPGIGGVRIEDDIVITKTGCKVLTRSPKKIEEVIF